MAQISLRWIAHRSPDYAQAVALRHRVLREPLGLEFTPEELDAEYDQLHLLAMDDAGQPVGCLSLMRTDERTMKMRQVAVAPEMQGQGLGRLLVNESERRASELGCDRIVLHARETATAFYLALGYAVIGEQFTEVGIPHFRMEKSLLV